MSVAKYTDEERKEWRSKMAAMAKRVREMPENERQKIAERLGTVTCEGHRLSVHNTVFLWQQCGRPLLQVGGVRQWNKVGRAVEKGQRAAGYIYVPMRKEHEGDGDSELKFRLIPVFSIEQTVETQ